MFKKPKFNKFKRSAIVFFFCAASFPATFSAPANADTSEQAVALLKAMSDYMSSKQQISFDYDANLEIITPDLQKIGLASSGALSLNRPSQVRMSRHGGFVNAELAYDGTTLGLLGKNQNAFTKIETAGSIDDLIDTLRHDFGFSVPAADLLSSDPFGALTFNVTDSKDLGSGLINGRECNHLAFRTEETDWQIWIAQGEAPFPCRLTITSKLVSQGPEYRVDITNWKTGGDVAADDFQINASADAKEVTPSELFGLDEVSGLTAEGASQ
jgi:hypothetical protein